MNWRICRSPQKGCLDTRFRDTLTPERRYYLESTVVAARGAARFSLLARASACRSFECQSSMGSHPQRHTGAPRGPRADGPRGEGRRDGRGVLAPPAAGVLRRVRPPARAGPRVARGRAPARPCTPPFSDCRGHTDQSPTEIREARADGLVWRRTRRQPTSPPR